MLIKTLLIKKSVFDSEKYLIRLRTLNSLYNSSGNWLNLETNDVNTEAMTPIKTKSGHYNLD